MCGIGVDRAAFKEFIDRVIPFDETFVPAINLLDEFQRFLLSQALLVRRPQSTFGLL